MLVAQHYYHPPPKSPSVAVCRRPSTSHIESGQQKCWPGAFLAAAAWGGQWGGHICIWGAKNSGWHNVWLSEWCNLTPVMRCHAVNTAIMWPWCLATSFIRGATGGPEFSQGGPWPPWPPLRTAPGVGLASSERPPTQRGMMTSPSYSPLKIVATRRARISYHLSDTIS